MNENTQRLECARRFGGRTEGTNLSAGCNRFCRWEYCAALWAVGLCTLGLPRHVVAVETYHAVLDPAGAPSRRFTRISADIGVLSPRNPQFHTGTLSTRQHADALKSFRPDVVVSRCRNAGWCPPAGSVNASAAPPARSKLCTRTYGTVRRRSPPLPHFARPSEAKAAPQHCACSAAQCAGVPGDRPRYRRPAASPRHPVRDRARGQR